MWKWCCFFILVITLNASADEFYGQDFPGTSSTGSVSLGSYSWAGFYGNSNTAATLTTPGSGGTAPNGQVSNGGTAPNITQTANATVPASSSNAEGVAFIAAPNNTDQYVLETNTAIPRSSLGSGSTFSWYAAGNIGDTQRLTLEIGSQWYVSTTVFTINFSTSTTSAMQVAANAMKVITPFASDSSSWQTLSFTPGLTIGANSALADGDIAAFGVYLTGGQAGVDKNFVDSYEVDTAAAPEPIAGTLILPMMLLLRKRRR